MKLTVTVYKGRGEKPIAMETFKIPDKYNYSVTATRQEVEHGDNTTGVAEAVWDFMTRDRGVPLSELRFESKVSE